MITGIPDYQTPVEIGVRCLCRRYYVVFTGQGMIIGDAEGRARERAVSMRAEFVDARLLPFMNCTCGQVLDFTSEATLMLQ